MQKVRYSRRAEALGRGQYWGPTRTEARRREKGVPENPSYSIVASGGGDRSISNDLMAHFARDSMSGYEGAFYVVWMNLLGDICSGLRFERRNDRGKREGTVRPGAEDLGLTLSWNVTT